MVSDERLVWLLGHDRPARVIPAGLIRDPVGEVAAEDHTLLHELEPEPANEHPQAVPGHDNHILAYPHDPDHDHYVLISASNQELLDHHLATTSIWVRASKPGEEAAEEGPKPLYLVNLIKEAVATVTGSSLEELSEVYGDDQPSDLAGLLGDAAGDVHGVAVEVLMRGLESLAGTGVIDSGDFEALDLDSLIDTLLTEPRDDVDADDDAIVTTILHPPGVHQVHFSMKIEG